MASVVRISKPKRASCIQGEFTRGAGLDGVDDSNPSRSKHPPSFRPSTHPYIRILLLAVALPIATLVSPVTAQEHTPFGYQSDSSESVEYRNYVEPDVGDPPSDPSSYAGSVHYDPIHHALYVTGATFASGLQPFDGLDVYQIANELANEDENQEGIDWDGNYWWNDRGTGLTPHLHDLGVPEKPPGAKGDCFYAIFGLPVAGGPGTNPEQNQVPTADNEVRLVHSRRFGTELNAEACSTIDVMHGFPLRDGIVKEPGAGESWLDSLSGLSSGPVIGETTPEDPSAHNAVGGYYYNFGHNVQQDPSEGQDYNNSPNDGATDDYTDPGLGSGEGGDMDYEEMNMDDASVQQAEGDELVPTESPTPAATSWSPTITAEPSSSTYLPTYAPNIDQGRIRNLRSQRNILDEIEDVHSEPVLQNGGKSPQQRSTQVNVLTRSVRFLIAGHVESSDENSGYIVDDLPPGTYDERKVYGFAQQVDVRLPVGQLDGGGGKFYQLHNESMTEQEFGLNHDPGDSPNLPQDSYERIVTSGVESRALLNIDMPSTLKTVYPVAVLADPTTKKHYYVAMLVSNDASINIPGVRADMNYDPTIGAGASQRSWTDYPEKQVPGESANDDFGELGRPNYGKDYKIMVRRMTIESDIPETELSDVDKILGAEAHSQDGSKVIVMRNVWEQEFEPDAGEDVRCAGMIFAASGNQNGDGDMLVLVGTTSGQGNAFGTNKGSFATQDQPSGTDMDGFVMKIRVDEGEFAGHPKFDTATNQFKQTHSARISSSAGEDEIVAGVCATPSLHVGFQQETKKIYVVGSTSALLEGMNAEDRNDEFVNVYSENDGSKKMEAFLMKFDYGTMEVEWVRQIGAFVPGTNMKGNAFGYGCAVTPDGKTIHLSGLVKEKGIATDFSAEDWTNHGNAEGGTDIFVASYDTDGTRKFLKQIGSTRDDFPSRSNGGITTDRFGNAIITGNTRGSLMRKRNGNEYRYGRNKRQAASDVFVMSLDRATGDYVPIMHDGVDDRVPQTVVHLPAPNSRPETPPVSAPAPETPATATNSAAAPEDIETKNGALIGVVAISLGFIVLSAGAYTLVVYKIKGQQNKERVFMETNLHGSGGGKPSSQTQRKSRWGFNPTTSSPMEYLKANNVDIMVEVRNSASGGFHGVYDDDQLQAIDFGTPAPDQSHVVEDSLFTEDGLQEIEDAHLNYEIGEMDADVSDEDLIKAYNDAMALDIEPENEDVEFAMAGMGGSASLMNDDHEHQFT